MKLTDVAPVEDWLALQAEVEREFGLGPVIYDAAGTIATQYECQRNPVCHAIRNNPECLTQVCSLSNQNMMATAKRTREVVIDVCDAGFMKAVVPIFAGDELLGVCGVCGVLRHGEKVDSFYIGKLTGLPEKEVEALAKEAVRWSGEDMQSVTEYVSERIDEVMTAAAR